MSFSRNFDEFSKTNTHELRYILMKIDFDVQRLFFFDPRAIIEHSYFS